MAGLPALVADHFTRSDAEKSAVRRGRVLEDLAVAVFGLIPGVRLYRRNHFSAGRSAEFDVSFVNTRSENGLYLLEALFLVECKNTRRKTAAREIRNFATKIRQAGLINGVLVTARGVSGSPTARTAGWDAILRAKSEGTWVVPITRDELTGVADIRGLVRLLTDNHLLLFGFG